MGVHLGNKDKMPQNVLLQDQTYVKFVKEAQFSVGVEMAFRALNCIRRTRKIVTLTVAAEGKSN
jgi:hypothetical protein